MNTHPLIVIAHNIRSTHNIGAIFRTAEGFGVEKIYLGGYTPYPTEPHDTRLPHLREKLTQQIHKTALGAEKIVPFEHYESFEQLIISLKQKGVTVVGLEQDERSVPLTEFTLNGPTALVLGEEVHGIAFELRSLCEVLVEIPMLGKKESFNVSVACGIALYALRTGQ